MKPIQDNQTAKIPRATTRKNCPRGHDLTLPNVISEVGDCLTCRRDRERNYKRRVKEAKTHCKKGHELTPDNVIQRTVRVAGLIYPYRECKTCRKAANSTYKDKKRTAQQTGNLTFSVQAKVEAINQEILAIADRQDLAGGWERQQLRARVAELTAQKDKLERKSARRVAQ